MNHDLNTKLDAKDEEISSLRASCHSFDLQVGELQRERDNLLREAVPIIQEYARKVRTYWDNAADFADDPQPKDEEIGLYEPMFLTARTFLSRPEVQAFIKKEARRT